MALQLRDQRLEDEKSRREKAVADPSLLKRTTGGVAEDDQHSFSEHSFISSRDNERLLRVWNVKKNDPTVPIYHNSVYRRLAAIKPRTSLTSTLERNVDVTYNNLYEEITSPSHIYKVRMGFQKRDKFRRSFEEEAALNASIPHSAHSVRSIKHGTLFPTYEANLKEAKRKQIDEMLAENSKNNRGRKKVKKFDIDAALTQSKSNGGAPTNPFFLTELDDEIRNLSNEEYIDKNRIVRTGAGVITDEMGLEYEANLDRISRMKSIRNKLSQIHREKKRTLVRLESDISRRNESDQQLIGEVQSSEVLLRSLHQRNITMERNLEEAKQLEEGYNELLKVLKKNPPYMEAHVQSLEMESGLAEKQFQDMVAHRHQLYHEKEKEDALKMEDFRDQYAYFAHARTEVAQKKRQVRREIMHLKDPSTHNERRNTKGAGVHPFHGKGDPPSPTGSHDSYDSDESEVPEEKALQLTKPVMHFLNAMVRKVTLNDNVVKETDKTLDDVKQRSMEGKSTDDLDNGHTEKNKKIQAIAARRATKRPPKKEESIIIPSSAFMSPAEVAAQVLHPEGDAASLDSSTGSQGNGSTHKQSSGYGGGGHNHGSSVSVTSKDNSSLSRGE